MDTEHPQRIAFTDMEPPRGALSQEQAIVSLKRHVNLESATLIGGRFGIMRTDTASGEKPKLDDTPVWLLAFSGRFTASAGRGASPRPGYTQMQFVVHGITGAYIVSLGG